MSHARWRAALRQLNAPRSRIVPSRNHILTRYRSTFNKPPTRVEHLQSRFPTKTVTFLLALGAAAYYFDIFEIQFGDHWTNHLDTGDGLPFHFYKTVEDLDQWLALAPGFGEWITNPEAQALIMEKLSLETGFTMTEKEAVDADIPVTHGVRFGGNYPCEDFYALGTSPGPGAQKWSFWGVFDGHAGWSTSSMLQMKLIPYVSRALSTLQESSSPFAIANSIAEAFTRLDSEIMTTAKQMASWHPPASAGAIAALAPALSGSCALLACFDPNSSKLRVACTGDSRAVLGRWDPVKKKYIAKPLSVDQTGYNQSEIDRLTKEHPDEPDMIDPSSGRLLGFEITRAFGDHRLKWDNELIKQIQYKFWGTAPRPNSKTPPYATAEPVITETEIARGDDAGSGEAKADFMILASDGLWNLMSSEHAVELVHLWLEARERGNGKVTNDPQRPRIPIPGRQDIIEPGVEYDVEGKKETTWKAESKYDLIDDDNAAICLLKNAWGGSRLGLVLGIWAMNGPRRRMAVDDTTILVVFFDRARGKVKKEKKGWFW
ncbi:protein serine/threonine phosphatase 2C [Zopfia rhizophila CBS 207.26]|uniref:Protein serine/threonine phosphatase 2C n=1 Tax=Zopfia rhizophila CBS 207.26 TaxID=1314779 RepID=A0A6A6DRX8_9PEZI|nr:protein serine/threonine phosphatase 2C [Zopfia rhizophila CBS 207.26]